MLVLVQLAISLFDHQLHLLQRLLSLRLLLLLLLCGLQASLRLSRVRIEEIALGTVQLGGTHPVR